MPVRSGRRGLSRRNAMVATRLGFRQRGGHGVAAGSRRFTNGRIRYLVFLCRLRAGRRTSGGFYNPR